MIHTPYSFTKINTFFQCKRKYYNQYISHEKGVETEVLARGAEVHLDIHKDNVTETTKGALEYKHSGQLLKKEENVFYYKNNEGKTYTQQSELRFGFDEKGEQTTWGKSYYRGIIDLIRIYYKKDIYTADNTYLVDCVDKVEIIDWKTGSSKGVKQQLEFYAVPYLLQDIPVTCTFYYTDKKTKDIWNINKKGEELLEKISNKINKIEEHLKEGGLHISNFPKSRTKLCEYCSFRALCAQKPMTNKVWLPLVALVGGK